MGSVTELHVKLREISKLVSIYESDKAPLISLNGSAELRGFGHSTLTLAVHKETQPVEFAHEQAEFMLFLGDQVCPRILSIDTTGYVMEYLKPASVFIDSIWAQERTLEHS